MNVAIQGCVHQSGLIPAMRRNEHDYFNWNKKGYEKSNFVKYITIDHLHWASCGLLSKSRKRSRDRCELQESTPCCC